MGGAMAAITAVFSVIALLLEVWTKAAPKRAKEKKDEAIQRGRQDLHDGNADAVTTRLGIVFDAPPLAGSGNAGGAGDADQGGTGRIHDRLAALGIRIGEAPGESGKL